MADIFISYSSKDREWVSKFAETLGRYNLNIWWDPEIKPGQNYRQVIQDALDSSSCVIVLWSTNSIKSIWVQSEATQAIDRGVLIPVSIEEIRIPMPFNSIHTAILDGWSGDESDIRFKNLISGIKIHCPNTIIYDEHKARNIAAQKEKEEREQKEKETIALKALEIEKKARKVAAQKEKEEHEQKEKETIALKALEIEKKARKVAAQKEKEEREQKEKEIIALKALEAEHKVREVATQRDKEVHVQKDKEESPPKELEGILKVFIIYFLSALLLRIVTHILIEFRFDIFPVRYVMQIYNVLFCSIVGRKNKKLFKGIVFGLFFGAIGIFRVLLSTQQNISADIVEPSKKRWWKFWGK